MNIYCDWFIFFFEETVNSFLFKCKCGFFLNVFFKENSYHREEYFFFVLKKAWLLWMRGKNILQLFIIPFLRNVFEKKKSNLLCFQRQAETFEAIKVFE